jgi:hypothetical protein
MCCARFDAPAVVGTDKIALHIHEAAEHGDR